MGSTVTTAASILKDKYIGPIREAFTVGTTLIENTQIDKESYDGKAAVLSVNNARSSGLGGAAEDGTLPTATNQAFKSLSYTMVPVYGRFELTGLSIAVSKTDAGSFARNLDREMKGLIRDFKSDYNRILNGDGSETLTLINGAATSATQTVDSTRFLSDGDTVLVDTDQVTVSSITNDTTVVFTGSFTSADNDIIKRRIGASAVAEPDGIALMIDDAGTVGGLGRSTNSWLKAVELGNSGTNRALTLPLMDSLTRNVEKRKNSLPDAFYGKHELRDAYGQLLQNDKRYVNTQTMDGGKKVLSHNDVPFLTDFHATDNTIYAPTWDTLIRFEAAPIDWMDKDGAVLSRVANKDNYEGTLVYYSQFGTNGWCRFNAKLTDVTEAA